ncbi:MAG: hypothetical protein B6I25_01190 [Planctomycetales bacterium 4572_13]|nr:MAG: hypothetical protein B6I25_01190 [Planctomycetales bacterium 4572_13]
MDEERRLKGALSWQHKPRQTESCLGDEVFSYLKYHNRTLMKNAVIMDAWEAVVPPTLQPFCRLDKRVGSTLYLQAATGPYMHQAQMLSGELLNKIKQLAPRCGIQKIKVVPIRNNNRE